MNTSENKVRAIYVENEEPVRNMGLALLDAIQVEVEAHESPNAALARLTTGLIQIPQPWDLLITDYDMPELTGEGLARKVRALEGGANFPILVITGRLQEAIQDYFTEGIFNGYLKKPYRIAALKSSIEQTIKRSF